jgi:hypothetical protein
VNLIVYFVSTGQLHEANSTIDAQTCELTQYYVGPHCCKTDCDDFARMNWPRLPLR